MAFVQPNTQNPGVMAIDDDNEMLIDAGLAPVLSPKDDDLDMIEGHPDDIDYMIEDVDYEAHDMVDMLDNTANITQDNDIIEPLDILSNEVVAEQIINMDDISEYAVADHEEFDFAVHDEAMVKGEDALDQFGDHEHFDTLAAQDDDARLTQKTIDEEIHQEQESGAYDYSNVHNGAEIGDESDIVANDNYTAFDAKYDPAHNEQVVHETITSSTIRHEGQATEDRTQEENANLEFVPEYLADDSKASLLDDHFEEPAPVDSSGDNADHHSKHQANDSITSLTSVNDQKDDVAGNAELGTELPSKGSRGEDALRIAETEINGSNPHEQILEYPEEANPDGALKAAETGSHSHDSDAHDGVVMDAPKDEEEQNTKDKGGRPTIPTVILHIDDLSDLSLFPPSTEFASLAPYSEYDAAIPDHHVAYKGLDKCLSTLKLRMIEQTPEKISKNDELGFSIPQLGLEVYEDSVECSSCTFEELSALYYTLAFNDGAKEHEPMHVYVLIRQRFLARLNALQCAGKEQKGLSSIPFIKEHWGEDETYSEEYDQDVNTNTGSCEDEDNTEYYPEQVDHVEPDIAGRELPTELTEEESHHDEFGHESADDGHDVNTFDVPHKAPVTNVNDIDQEVVPALAYDHVDVDATVADELHTIVDSADEKVQTDHTSAEISGHAIHTLDESHDDEPLLEDDITTFHQNPITPTNPEEQLSTTNDNVTVLEPIWAEPNQNDEEEPPNAAYADEADEADGLLDDIVYDENEHLPAEDDDESAEPDQINEGENPDEEWNLDDLEDGLGPADSEKQQPATEIGHEIEKPIVLTPAETGDDKSSVIEQHLDVFQSDHDGLDHYQEVDGLEELEDGEVEHTHQQTTPPSPDSLANNKRAREAVNDITDKSVDEDSSNFKRSRVA